MEYENHNGLYKSGKISIYNMDCMEALRQTPDKYYDLCVCDPPYGIKQDGHRENNRSKLAISTNYHKALWDQPPPDAIYFRELERVSKNQIVWGGNHLAAAIGRSSPCWIVWDKFTSGGFADCELAYTSFKTAVRKFEYPWNGMIQGFFGSKSKNEDRINPTQKPIKLYEYLLTNYAKPGQRILDTHLGSGSSAIAAHYFGVDFVGCELDTDYYNAAKKRFEQATAQLAMFGA